MFKKADFMEKRIEARNRNPALFDRLISIANIGNHSECWPIFKNISAGGYGKLRHDGLRTFAHRLMFCFYYPGVDAPVVRHMCHNPGCINPAHLRAGTQKDNAEDRVNAKRGGDLKGENNGRSKLTARHVDEIRNSPEMSSRLAEKFNITRQMVYRIRTIKAWNHI
jgi:hypothetical protein